MVRSPHHPLWRLMSGQCNAVSAHGKMAVNLAWVAPWWDDVLTFSILREPVQRALSNLAYCRKGNRTSFSWCRFAVYRDGLAAVSPSCKLCAWSSKCFQPLNRNGSDDPLTNFCDEGPLFGNIHTFYFSDVGTDPDAPQAVAQAKSGLESLDVVGLVEFYEESICLFYFVAALDAHFDRECRPDGNGSAWASRTANASPHQLMVDLGEYASYARAIANDIAIYAHARVLFSRQICDLEKATGVSFPRVHPLMDAVLTPPCAAGQNAGGGVVGTPRWSSGTITNSTILLAKWTQPQAPPARGSHRVTKKLR